MTPQPDAENENIRAISPHEDLAWNETTAETEAREAAELLKGGKKHDQTQEKVSNAAPTSNPGARRKAEHDAVQAILDKDRPDQRPEARQSDTPRTDYEATLTATGLYVMVNFARTLERELATAVTHLARIEAGVKADAADLEKMRDGTKLTRAGVLEIIMEQKEQLATVTAERDKYRDDITAISRTMHDKIAEQQREILRLKEETEKLTKLADNIQAIAITLEQERDAFAAKLAEAQKDTERLMNAMETAWGIIANSGGGNWSLESKDWQEAAARWRDEDWYGALTRHGYVARKQQP